MSGRDKCFHIVDDCGLAEIAMSHRKWRPIARYSALAFHRFEQRGFFAADVGSRPYYDFYIKIEFRIDI